MRMLVVRASHRYNTHSSMLETSTGLLAFENSLNENFFL